MQRVFSNLPIFTSLLDVFLITVNCKHFDNKHTHYVYSNKYLDTKISLLKPQTVHFKSSHQQLKKSFYQYQFILITFDNINQFLQSALTI